MKRSQLALIMVITLVLILFAGCSGNKSKIAENAIAEDAIKEYTPEWWGAQPIDAYICTYGIAEKVTEEASMEAAKASAFLETKNVEEYVNSILSKIQTETAVKDQKVLELAQKVMKEATETLYINVVIGKTETHLNFTPEGERYKTFLQLMIPKMEIHKNIIEQIRNDDALYKQFKDSQTFLNLETDFH